MNFVSVECDDEDIGEEAMSCDSVDVERVCLLDPMSIFPGQTLAYICETSDGDEEVYDRSDLMDGGRIQKLVLAYERKNPPPWQPCPLCGGDEDCECEECVCDECERPCRFLNGTNYGCPYHPVV